MKLVVLKYRVFILLLLLTIGGINAQSIDSINQKKNIKLSMTIERGKIDFFHNIQLNTELFECIQMEANLGFNVNKTYFQATIAPQFSLGFGYDLFKKKKNFSLMPGMKGRLTTFNMTEDVRFNYLEGLLGYSLVWGDKWYIVHGSYFGRGREFVNDDINNHVKYWTYAIHLGVGYNF